MRRSQVRLLFPAPVVMKSPGLGRGFLFVALVVPAAGRQPVVPAHGWQPRISELRDLFAPPASQSPRLTPTRALHLAHMQPSEFLVPGPVL